MPDPVVEGRTVAKSWTKELAIDRLHQHSESQPSGPRRDIAKQANELIQHEAFLESEGDGDSALSPIAQLLAQISIAVLEAPNEVLRDQELDAFRRDLNIIMKYFKAKVVGNDPAEFHNFKSLCKKNLGEWYGRLKLRIPKALGACGCRCDINCNCRCACKCSCRCRRSCTQRCGDVNPGSGRRNLVVSIDGTSNQFSSSNTNVVELQSRIIRDDPGVQQLTYYSSGIGTYAPTSQRSISVGQKFSSVLDLAFARSFEKILQGAYRWLVDHYQTGDHVYLFGFSRGAYQVRTLAAMIKKVGLLHPGNREQIPFAYEIYIGKIKDQGNPGAEAKMARHFKRTFSQKVEIHFLGVWDTVASVGLMRGKSLPLTEKPYYIHYFRHALALDERRVKFLPEYWGGARSKPMEHQNNEDREWSHDRLGPDSLQSGNTQDKPSMPRVKEVWFAGSHSDIGGGNRNTEVKQDLAGAPLTWMENEAMRAGLVLVPRSPTKELNYGRVQQSSEKSLSGVWWLLEFLPLRRLSYATHSSVTRVPNCGRGRSIVDGQKLHASIAFAKPDYFPFAKRVSDLANDRDIDWPSLVGHARLDDFSWAIGYQELLEMGFFDKSIIVPVLEKLKEIPRESLTSDIDRLRYIALDSEGATALRKAGAIELISNCLITSAHPKLQRACADCLSQFAKYDSHVSERFINTDMVQQVLGEMVKTSSQADPIIQASAVLCLLWTSGEVRNVKQRLDLLFDEKTLEKFLVKRLRAHVPKSEDSFPYEVMERLLLCISRAVSETSIRKALYSEGIFSVVSKLLDDDGLSDKAARAGWRRLSLPRDPEKAAQGKLWSVPLEVRLHNVQARQNFGVRLLSTLAEYEDCQDSVDADIISKLDKIWAVQSQLNRRLLQVELIRCIARLAQYSNLRTFILDKRLLESIALPISRLDFNLLEVRDSISILMHIPDSQVKLQVKEVQKSLINSIVSMNAELHRLSLHLLDQMNFDHLDDEELFRVMELNLKRREAPLRYRIIHVITYQVVHRSAKFRERAIKRRLIQKLLAFIKDPDVSLAFISCRALEQLCQYGDCLDQVNKINGLGTLLKVLGKHSPSIDVRSLFQDPYLRSYFLMHSSKQYRISTHDSVLTLLGNMIQNREQNIMETPWLVKELVHEEAIALVLQLLRSDEFVVRCKAADLLRCLIKQDEKIPWISSSSGNMLPESLLAFLRSKFSPQALAVLAKLASLRPGSHGRSRLVDAVIANILIPLPNVSSELENPVPLLLRLAVSDATTSILASAGVFEELAKLTRERAVGARIVQLLAGPRYSTVVHNHLLSRSMIMAVMSACDSKAPDVSANGVKAVLAMQKSTIGPILLPNDVRDRWNRAILDQDFSLDTDAESSFGAFFDQEDLDAEGSMTLSNIDIEEQEYDLDPSDQGSLHAASLPPSKEADTAR